MSYISSSIKKLRNDVIIIKVTGFVRKLDVLGRIVVPVSLLRAFNIKKGNDADAEVEIYTEDDMIIIQKYVPKCSICGKEEKVMKEFDSKRICDDCLDDIKSM